jgi:hypothetical protein
MNKLSDEIAMRGGRSGRLLTLLAAILGSAMLVGCASSTPQVADSERASAALRQALEAWKNGETPQSLAEGTPPIHVSDAEWAGGAKLLEYSIDAEQSAGFGWRCDVTLKVQSAEGQEREHAATYRIDTDPAIVVVHE